MKDILSRLTAVLLLVVSGASCGRSKRELPEQSKAALIMLDTTLSRVTVRNTGDSNLADCKVAINSSIRLPDATPMSREWYEQNEVTIAVLHPRENIDIPLSTFAAYRDRSIFAGQYLPWASIRCGVWAYSSVNLPVQ